MSGCGDMSSCLLSDIPAAASQVVYKNVLQSDHINMRLVSNRVLKQYDQHIPYLTLRLSNSSTEQQLQQWCQAVKRLHHITQIRVKIINEVSSAVFTQAMQLLSQQLNNITGLQLLGDDFSGSSSSSFSITDGGCRYALLPSLQPLQHLLNRLHTLVISNIAVRDLADDLSQLIKAATGAAADDTLQLQSLVLQAAWSYPYTPHWSTFAPALQQLTRLFSKLQQLSISIPCLQCYPLAARVATTDDVQSYQERPNWRAAWQQLAGIAVVTAVAQAAVQLQQLEALTLADMPDIWLNRSPVETLAQAAAEDVAVLDAANESMPGLLPSASAAAAAASNTLDDYGCWLLQQHQSMRHLSIHTADTECGMSWQRQQRADCAYQSIADSINSSRSTSNARLRIAAKMHDVNINCAEEAYRLFVTTSVASLVRIGQHPRSFPFLFRSIDKTLTRCSSQPAALLMDHITSCRLAVYDEDIGHLAGVLRDMKPLKHLQLEAHLRMSSTDQPAIDSDDEHGSRLKQQATSATMKLQAAVAAAAGVKKLQTLKLHASASAGVVHFELDDLLLPLTAAAGGPGSSLKKLELSGPFSVTATAGTADVDNMMASGRVHGLQQLDGLIDLSLVQKKPPQQIYQQAGSSRSGWDQLLGVAVDSLPPRLKDFKAQNLSLEPASAAAGAAHNTQLIHTAAMGVRSELQHCHLQTLELKSCHLSSPGLLASQQLRALTVIDSSWPGGWYEAATAWPNVETLMIRYDTRTHLDGGSSTSSMCETIGGGSRRPAASEASARSSVRGIIQFSCYPDMPFGFKHLKSVTMQRCPQAQLSAVSLQCLLDYSKRLQRVKVLALRVNKSDRSNSSSSTLKDDIATLQQRLLQQLTWASVCITQE